MKEVFPYKITLELLKKNESFSAWANNQQPEHIENFRSRETIFVNYAAITPEVHFAIAKDRQLITKAVRSIRRSTINLATQKRITN